MFAMSHSIEKPIRFSRILKLAFVLAWMAAFLAGGSATAQVMNDSIVGNNNMTSSHTGVAVNGSTNGNVNNNQNNLSTGSNINQNTVSPVVIAPSSNQALYSGVNGGGGGTGGSGGAAALVMPRSPLPLPNALYGRSNFGLQFGVQNNPGINSMTGGEDALGFFLQGGLVIPFGKIPDIVTSQENRRMDEQRLQDIERERMGLRNPPPRMMQQQQMTTNVRGKVMQMNAFGSAPRPYGRMNMAGLYPLPLPQNEKSSGAGQQPRVLALAQAKVFTHPLNTGRPIGMVQIGREYVYLGHTSRGWVKILLHNGREGWTATHFEYIKFDYTQIDNLAVDPTARSMPKTAHVPESRTRGPVR